MCKRTRHHRARRTRTEWKRQSRKLGLSGHIHSGQHAADESARYEVRARPRRWSRDRSPLPWRGDGDDDAHGGRRQSGFIAIRRLAGTTARGSQRKASPGYGTQHLRCTKGKLRYSLPPPPRQSDELRASLCRCRARRWRPYAFSSTVNSPPNNALEYVQRA